MDTLKPKKHPDKALSAAAIRNARPGSKLCDGNGLYLFTDDSGAQHWVLRVVIKGRRHELGLGGLSLVSLAEAREEAIRLRKMARKGGDPLAERRQERRIVPTFEEAACKVHEIRSKSFTNEKHKADWLSSLTMYAFPIFGSRPVDQIDSPDVLTALSPIWTEKPETARRVKQRIKTVFAWCRVNKYCPVNPVEDVREALPEHDRRKEHFPALPYAKVAEFLTALHAANVTTAIKLAFEFLILTTSRTGEVIYAKWHEIDFEGKAWTVPPERMKTKEEHRVPLSTRCLEILKAAKEISDGGEYIFPGRSSKHPLSNMAFLMALRRMNLGDITAHGFRSSFRDWAEERTKFKRSIIEAALAHTIKDKVEAAYLRTKLFPLRVPLMEAWAAFVTAKPSQRVVNIREA